MTFVARNAQGCQVYHTNVMMAGGTGCAVVCAESVVDAWERKRLPAAPEAAPRGGWRPVAGRIGAGVWGGVWRGVCVVGEGEWASGRWRVWACFDGWVDGCVMAGEWV